MTRVAALLSAGAMGAWSLADTGTPQTTTEVIVKYGGAVGIMVTVFLAGSRIGRKMERVAITNEAQTKKLKEVQETEQMQLLRMDRFEKRVAEIDKKLEGRT